MSRRDIAHLKQVAWIIQDQSHDGGEPDQAPVLMDLHGLQHDWGEATPQTSRWSRTENARQQRTVTNRGLILENRGLSHLVISHTCSEMGSGNPWRKTRAQYRDGRMHKNKEKKEKRHSDLYWFGTSLKERKGEILSVLILKWKTSVYLKFESFRIKRQIRELIEPFSENPSVTEKMLRLSVTSPLCTHTHPPTHSSIHLDIWT